MATASMNAEERAAKFATAHREWIEHLVDAFGAAEQAGRIAEREACAKIADDAAEANASDYSPEGPVCAYTAECIAEEIRARSEPQKAEEENR